MKKSSGLTKNLILMLLTALLVTACGEKVTDQARGPIDSETKVAFKGLEHRALGRASLHLLDDRLVLGNIGATGDDGMNVRLGRANAWRAQLGLAAKPKAALTLTALQETEQGSAPASSLVMAHANYGWSLSSSFGSPTYDVQLFNNSTLAAREKNVPNGAQAVSIFDELWCVLEGGSSDLCRLTIEFRQNADGECAWELTLAEPAIFRSETGKVKANRIVLTENHRTHNHRHDAMIFTEMELNAAHLSSISVFDEAVKPSK